MSSAWFQLPVHNAAPPSLHGVRKGRSPASLLLWGTATPCRPSRRASFPSLGDTTVSSVVRPRRPRTWAADQPGVGGRKLGRDYGDGNWDAISIDSNPLLRRPSKLIAPRFPTPQKNTMP